MARPQSIADETLLDATRAVIRERGASTTTAEIAERAGVSEGTLFHRFGTKQKLFRAALLTLRPVWRERLEARVGRGDVFDELTSLAHEILEFMHELMPLLMFAANRSEEQRSHGEGIDGKRQTERALAAYFEAEARLGRIAPTDAEVLAYTFLGAIHNYAFNRYMQPDPRAMSLPEATFVRGLIQLLRGGLEPPKPAHRARAQRD
ncbi:MAG: helix-turn-helix domain-containing protein [Polyangiales bacterium]